MTGATRRDTGQAAVELALALPVVAVLVLGMVQVAVVVRHQLAIQVAARDAARAAAVAADPQSAAERTLDAVLALDADVTVVTGLLAVPATAEGSLQTVTAIVHYRETTDVPIIGLLVPDVDLDARVTVLREPP